MINLRLKQEAISFLVLINSLFIDATACNHSAIEEIQTIARRLRLYPHVIKTIPSNIVEVTYGGRKLELGGLLNADDLNDPPLVSWPTKEDALYVMVLSGPDAIDLDAQNSYEHWLIGNIPGTDLGKGEKLSEYVGLVKTAYRQGETHRLIFYVFKQPDGKHIQFEGERIKKEDTGNIRGMLSLDAFAKHYELGDPYGIHFFEVFFNKTKL